MKIGKIKFIAMLSALFLLTATAWAQTTTFTYQGKLTDTGNPPTAVYQMQFSLFDAVSGGTQIGATIPNNSVSVTQGIFTVNLDFGAAVFTGADRFLQIAVRRNAAESFVTLNPRQQITSSPYSIRTLSAAQADLALDSQQLGGVPASEYVTTSSVGNSFIRNSTTQQTADFNIFGNGTLGGTLQANEVRAQTGTGFYGLTQTDGITTVSSYISGSGGWFGTRSNSPLHFFTNDGSATMTLTGGNVGIGTITPTNKLDVFGGVRASLNGSTQMTAETTGGTNSWARFYMRSPNRSWFIGTSQNFNGDQFHLFDDTSGQFRMTVQPNGGAIAFPLSNVGIGTTTPNTRLTLNGGPSWTSAGWTASMNMQNASALGWEANASGQRFGIGQSNGGLYFFRTISGFGSTLTPANYDMQITDNGNLAQSEERNGLPKAMLYVNPFLLPTQYIVRCYNGVSGASTGDCGGFSVTRGSTGFYTITFPFPVNNRFYSLTVVANFTDILSELSNSDVYPSLGANQLSVSTFSNGGSQFLVDSRFMIIVY